MKLSSKIKPLSYLKVHASEIIRNINNYSKWRKQDYTAISPILGKSGEKSVSLARFGGKCL
nr:hypothetical protein [Flexistipes sinusarabici]